MSAAAAACPTATADFSGSEPEGERGLSVSSSRWASGIFAFDVSIVNVNVCVVGPSGGNIADVHEAVTPLRAGASAAPGAQVETSDVGGRQVVTVTNPSYTLAVTATGDTLIYIQSPDAELVTAAVEALPTAA